MQAGGDMDTLKKWYDTSLADPNKTGTAKYAAKYKRAMELSENERNFALPLSGR